MLMFLLSLNKSIIYFFIAVCDCLGTLLFTVRAEKGMSSFMAHSADVKSYWLCGLSHNSQPLPCYALKILIVSCHERAYTV